MKIATTLLVIILSMSNLFAQKMLRHTVYFPTDKHLLTEVERTKLDIFLSQLDTNLLESIQLNGHTDSDGSNAYNIALSQRRVETVRKVVSKSLNGEYPLDFGHYGEEQPVDANSSPSGKQNNRRVDIVVEMTAPKTIARNISEIPTPPIDRFVEEPKIEGDTIIQLPKGTLMVLPCAGFIQNPTCVSVTEYVDGESVRNAGLTTMASDGSMLVSGGMFDVKMCDESKCIKLLVPIRTVCGRTVPFTQWSGESNGTWSENTGNQLTIVTIDGRDYYEMEVCGSGRCNVDVCLPPEKKCKLFQPKTRIKLKNNYRINTVLLSADDPLFGSTPIRQTKRKAVYYRICPCSEQYLYVEATDKNGTTQTIEYRPIDSFDKREAFGKCKENEIVKKILFFKIRKKTMYRKYLVRKSDFENGV